MATLFSGLFRQQCFFIMHTYKGCCSLKMQINTGMTDAGKVLFY
jgi:hypothetical protein